MSSPRERKTTGRVPGTCRPLWQYSSDLDTALRDRFDVWRIAPEDAGTIVIAGSLPDQAALLGILIQIIHLGLTLLSLETSEDLREDSGGVQTRERM